MKKIIFIFLIIMSVNLFSIDKINIVVNNAPPYRIIENGNFSGIYIEIIQEIAKELNLEIKFHEVPFKRALIMMKTGDADIMLGPNKTSEREEFIYFLENFTLPKENKFFYVLNEENFINKYEDLYGKNIEILRGAVYFDKFDNDVKLLKNEISDYTQAILKVKIKRSDVVIMPELQGDYLLKNLDVNLIKSPYMIEGNLSYIGISKNSKNYNELKEKIKIGFQKIKEKKLDEEIIKKYTKK